MSLSVVIASKNLHFLNWEGTQYDPVIQIDKEPEA